MTVSTLPAEIARAYVALRTLPDGRIIGVARLLFHWTLHVDVDADGYADRYCFEHRGDALHELENWNGVGDPDRWHRHPKSGRRRNPATGEEWIAT